MDRIEKIALLNSIQKGTLTIMDIMPKELVQRIGINSPDRFKINKACVNEDVFNTEFKRQIKMYSPIKFEVTIEDYDFIPE